MKEYIMKQIKTYKGIFNHLPQRIPTNGEPDGPLCGNGDIGVVMGGTTSSLKFYLSKNDIWCAKPHHKGGGMKSIGFIEVVCDDLEEGDFEATQEIDAAHVKSKVTQESYSLSTDTFVYAHDNLIITKIKCLGEPLDLEVRCCATQELEANYEMIIGGNELGITKMYIGDDLPWHTKVHVRLKVLGQKSTAIHLENNQEVTVLTAIATNHDTEDYKNKCQELLDQVDETRLEHYIQEHNVWWENFWVGSGVHIPSEPEIEKFWYGSHYIMACCSRNKQFPPGIFGNWVTTDKPNWGADYHLNYNHQAPWWGVYSSNKVELSIPYDTPIIEGIPVAQKAAQEKLGCRGVYYKVGIGPKGVETSNIYNKEGIEKEDAAYWGQKSNGAYAAVNMLMRYYSTYDTTYAKEILYPYLEQVALFWEDYLRFEEGRYVVYNDCIHENWGPYSENPKAPDYSDDFNSLLTLGLLRVVFKGIVDVSLTIDKGHKQREKWLHILEHLSAFPTQMRDGKEVFRYTEKGMDWCNSNSLGIQHIYPCGTIGLGSDPKQLEIARNTLELLNRWEDYNAFPTFFTAAARLGYDPTSILKHMKEEFKKHAFDNMFIYYGGGGIECCSTVPSCINEMLMQSHEGVIRIFPVWERTKDVQFYKLRAYGAFVISAYLEKGMIQPIKLLSEKGQVCHMENPWPEGTMSVYKVLGNTLQEVPTKVTNQVVAFDTCEGAKYIVLNKEWGLPIN